MNRKLITVWGLFAVVTMLTLTAASCSRGADPDPTPDASQTGDQTDPNATTGGLDGLNLPPTGTAGSGSVATNAPFSGLQDPNVARQSMGKEVTDAIELIKGLKDDTVLQLVSMKFINSLSDQAGLATNYYIFSSPSDPRYYYLVNVPHNGERMKRFLMPREDLDLPFDLIPVQKTEWKLTYVDALRLAEAQGGSAFISAHPKFEVSAILARPAGQTLSWFIAYRATEGSGDIFQISVDASTGEVRK